MQQGQMIGTEEKFPAIQLISRKHPASIDPRLEALQPRRLPRYLQCIVDQQKGSMLMHCRRQQETQQAGGVFRGKSNSSGMLLGKQAWANKL